MKQDHNDMNELGLDMGRDATLSGEQDASWWQLALMAVIFLLAFNGATHLDWLIEYVKSLDARVLGNVLIIGIFASLGFAKLVTPRRD